MEPGELLEVTSATGWRKWLERYKSQKKEIWLVFYKKTSGRKTISYEEAVLEALCFGWIDGQMISFDRERYSIRFTARSKRSNWSLSNIERIRRLVKDGRMTDSDLAVIPEEILKKIRQKQLPGGYSPPGIYMR